MKNTKLNTKLMTAMLLGFAQTSVAAEHGQPSVIWQPNLGKKKIKPRNKRGSNWTSAKHAKDTNKPHSQRNKKGKP
jgi:hypothetical protein